MKKLAVLLCVLLMLAGCVRLGPQDVVEVRLISNEGAIYAPLINGAPWGYNACVQPGDDYVLDFNPGRDQYGNRTGLSASRYTVEEVTVQCELKTEQDTIFLVINATTRWAEPNLFVWFPGYTAPNEQISGLPVPFQPLTGYPWDPCRGANLAEMASQVATVEVVARANWIEVEFVLPEGGRYRLEGRTWTDEHSISMRLTDPGAYIVAEESGELYEFDVPIDWFYIDAAFQVNVGPTGVC